MQTRFIPFLSNCRICMDQSLTGFHRVGQKLSDVIPVLWIMPRATEPSTVSVFLSSVKCDRICRAQTCAHCIEPSTLASPGSVLVLSAKPLLTTCNKCNKFNKKIVV